MKIRFFLSGVLLLCFLSAASPAKASTSDTIVRTVDYRFCLKEFKDYEKAKNGDRAMHDLIGSIPGGNPEILITQISKNMSGELSIDALYAFASAKPELVKLRCTIKRSTISFSNAFLTRVKQTAITRTPEYREKKRRIEIAADQKKRQEKERSDRRAEKNNEVHALRIKALIEKCWKFETDRVWRVRLVVRKGRIRDVKVFWPNEESREVVIMRALLNDALTAVSYSSSCPTFPVEGPIEVYLGPS